MYIWEVEYIHFGLLERGFIITNSASINSITKELGRHLFISDDEVDIKKAIYFGKVINSETFKKKDPVIQ